MTGNDMLSIVIPLYRSEENLPRLLQELERIVGLFKSTLEVVFVVDGSPDQCAAILRRRLPGFPARTQLLELSRNFGAFAAISAGLTSARGDYFVVIAADLQEPPELALDFLAKMQAGADIVFGLRVNRSDPAISLLTSNIFWACYRRLVNPEIPPGGVDVFGCNRKVRDQICSMKEVETSLVGLLFWIGYKREFVPYQRRQRIEGRSAWTFSRKVRYLINSVFNFTDLPIRLLLATGAIGIAAAFGGTVTVLIARLNGTTQVPGYTATVLTIMFFGGLTVLGLGIVGQYVWLCLQNTRARPQFLVDRKYEYEDVSAEIDAAEPLGASRKSGLS
jgi:polyisoprenyl-phosphate glycosyltransferase